MQELSRSNQSEIITGRVKYPVDGLCNDPDEKVFVWFRKLSYAELRSIEEILEIEDTDEKWLASCKLVQSMTYNGDNDQPLYETIDAVGDLPWKVVQVLSRGIIEANSAGSKTEDTVEKVKND